jgi:hypothetical protein
MNKYFFILFLLLLAFLFWSPWQTKESAERAVTQAFEASQMSLTEDCNLDCEDCGVESSQKIPFGYLIEIKYQCGLKYYLQKEKRFVTPMGTSLVIQRFGKNYPCSEGFIYSQKDCECISDPHFCGELDQESCETNSYCEPFSRDGNCSCPLCETWLNQCLPKED